MKGGFVGIIILGFILAASPEMLKALINQPVVYQDVELIIEGKPSVVKIIESDGTPVALSSDRAREILAGRYDRQFTSRD